MALLHRVRMVWSGWQGGPGLSTFYFKTSPTPSAADAAAVAGRVRSAFATLAASIPNTMTLQVDSVVDTIDDANGNLASSFGIAAPAVIAGTSTNGPSAPQLMVGLVLSTSAIVNGRRLKGRSFVGPLQANAVNSLTVPSATQTAVNAVGTALVGVTPPLSNPLMVWHRPTSTAAGSSSEATSAVASARFFTLRSRQRS